MHKLRWRLLAAFVVALAGCSALAALASFGLHIRSFDTQVTAIVWAVIALVSLRFQLPNLLNSLVNAKVSKLMQSRHNRALSLTFVHRNLIRTAVIPLMLLVGVIAMFLPAPPPPPKGYTQPLLQLIAGWTLLVALIGNEIGFGFLAVLEFRQMGAYKSLKNLRRSLELS